jgi:hypothetical protein
MSNPTYEPIHENLNEPATKGDLRIFAGEIGERLGNLPTREDFSQLLTAVDKLAGQTETYNAERSAETHRLERLEIWAKKVSATINVPIEF